MDALARPAEHEDRTGPEMWVDEAIWGHRLHDEQSPWLTVLEFLCVLHSEHASGRALTETSLNSLSYKPQTQLRLRNLLFNNPYMATVLASDLSDDAMWQSWLPRMEENAGGIERPTFAYLRDRFETFRDFASVISFLQSSAIEGSSNKRWSSKFVFPMLCQRDQEVAVCVCLHQDALVSEAFLGPTVDSVRIEPGEFGES